MEDARRLWIGDGIPTNRLPAAAASGLAVGSVLLATAVVGLLVYQFGIVVVLAVAALGAAGCAMLFRPDLAIVVTVFVLYLNVPAILHKHHGVPEMLAGSFLLLLGIPLLRIIVLRRQRFVADTSFWLMLVFLAVLLVSTQFAKDTGVAANYIRRYLLEGVLIYWLVTNVTRTLPDLKRILVTLLAAGALLGGVNLYQEITKSYHQKFGGLAYRPMVVVDETTLDQEPSTKEKLLRAERAHGPVEEPNRFAQILVVLLPFVVFLARSARRRATRVQVAGAGLLILAGMVVSFSRMAAIVLVLATFAAVGLRWIRPRYVLACGFLLILLVPVVAPDMVRRLESITAAAKLASSDPTDYGEMDGAMRGRATNMLAAFNTFLDHPVLGVGPGQYAPFYSLHYHQTGVGAKFHDVQKTKRAHTLYFEVAAETGIVGTFVFLSIVGVLMRRLWKARLRLRARDSELVDLSTACILALVCYLGTGIFLHLAYQRYYWFLLAIAGAALHIIHSIESTTAHVGPSTPAGSPLHAGGNAYG